MNTRDRLSQPRLNRPQTALSTVTVAVLSALSLSQGALAADAAPAPAAAASGTQLDTVVVTGFRASLESAQPTPFCIQRLLETKY